MTSHDIKMNHTIPATIDILEALGLNEQDVSEEARDKVEGCVYKAIEGYEQDNRRHSDGLSQRVHNALAKYWMVTSKPYIGLSAVSDMIDCMRDEMNDEERKTFNSFIGASIDA